MSISGHSPAPGSAPWEPSLPGTHPPVHSLSIVVAMAQNVPDQLTVSLQETHTVHYSPPDIQWHTCSGVGNLHCISIHHSLTIFYTPIIYIRGHTFNPAFRSLWVSFYFFIKSCLASYSTWFSCTYIQIVSFVTRVSLQVTVLRMASWMNTYTDHVWVPQYHTHWYMYWPCMGHHMPYTYPKMGDATTISYACIQLSTDLRIHFLFSKQV